MNLVKGDAETYYRTMSQSIKNFRRLPQVQSGWNLNNAFFKGEGTQTNIGLWQGQGLEIFNRNLINFMKTGGK